MTTVYLAPTFGAGYQGFTTGGLPLNAGLLYTYAAGGTTPTATYTTSSANVQNANPIVLDADGRTPAEVWLIAGTSYRFDVKDSAGNLIKTYDNLYGIGDPTAPNQTSPVYSLTSVAGTANAITANAGNVLTALAAQQLFVIVPSATSTGATTLTVTGASAFTAKNVFSNGAACTGGELKIGVPALLEYDGTQFNIVGPQSLSGSFTGTLTGCTTSPTMTINYTKIGNQVTISMDSTGFNGLTSNAVTKTITGMPAAIRPSRTVDFYARGQDNGGATGILLVEIESTGVINFYVGAAGAAWTNSGTCSINKGFTWTYTQA